MMTMDTDISASAAAHSNPPVTQAEEEEDQRQDVDEGQEAIRLERVARALGLRQAPPPMESVLDVLSSLSSILHQVATRDPISLERGRSGGVSGWSCLYDCGGINQETPGGGLTFAHNPRRCPHLLARAILERHGEGSRTGALDAPR